jgi:hypothetical protein
VALVVCTKERHGGGEYVKIGQKSQVEAANQTLESSVSSPYAKKEDEKELTDSLSPLLMLWQPICIAVIEDEHAVSMVILGPLRLKNHEMRLA